MKSQSKFLIKNNKHSCVIKNYCSYAPPTNIQRQWWFSEITFSVFELLQYFVFGNNHLGHSVKYKCFWDFNLEEESFWKAFCSFYLRHKRFDNYQRKHLESTNRKLILIKVNVCHLKEKNSKILNKICHL